MMGEQRQYVFIDGIKFNKSKYINEIPLILDSLDQQNAIFLIRSTSFPL